MENSEHPLLKGLNKEQKAAVTHGEGPMLILAGAGSGKTRVLTHRIAYLMLEKRVPSYRILAMTFTNKAAKEMKERIEKLTGIDVKNFWIGTFHSVFAKILRFEAEALGYTSNYSIYDVTDQENVIKRIMESHNINSKTVSPKKIQSVISNLKNKMITPEEFEKVHSKKDNFDQALTTVYWEYNVRLKRNNAMDFDDLLNNTIKLFREHEQIRKKYQDKFDYILIDEYQDTNMAQFEIIRILSEGHGNICVVGDDDQSIYRWRGAEVKNVYKFAEVFKNKTVYRLEQNYRSTPQILAVANHLIAHNGSRMEKELWTSNPAGDKPVLYTYPDPRTEAYRIVEKIKELRASFGYEYRDFAILYRTNAQSRYLEEELRKNNIHYLIYGGMRFYERKEVKDMLAYLRLIVNKRDDVALERIINVPARKIGKQTLTILREIAVRERCGTWDIIESFPRYSDSFRGTPPLEKFASMINGWIDEQNSLSPDLLFDKVLQESGLYDMYVSEAVNENIDRLENIGQLKAGLMEFVNNSSEEEATLENYLQQISLISDVDNPQGHMLGVKMMTIHMAKGLEFPVVFIAGLEENLFPHILSMGDPEQIEEERRLFYVAVTRAKEKVFMSNCLERERYREGRLEFAAKQSPSRFLREIPASLMEMKAHSTISGVSANKKGTFGYGDWVIHETYGRGQVVEVVGRPPREKISVVFDDNIIRTFYTHVANLQKEM